MIQHKLCRPCVLGWLVLHYAVLVAWVFSFGALTWANGHAWLLPSRPARSSTGVVAVALTLDGLLLVAELAQACSLARLGLLYSWVGNIVTIAQLASMVLMAVVAVGHVNDAAWCAGRECRALTAVTILLMYIKLLEAAKILHIKFA